MCTKFGESGSNWVNMSEVLVAEQLTNNLDEVPQYESKFNEGDTGELRLFLQSDITQTQVNEIEWDIISKGVILVDHVVQDARMLIIRFQKAIEPLYLISSSIGLIVNMLVGWQIYKTSGVAIPSWLWLVSAGVLLIALGSIRKGS